MITKEIYDRLSKYESILWTAHHASYVRATKSSDLNELRDIYKEIHGRTFDGSMSCNSCVVRLCKQLYGDAQEYVDSLPKKEEEYVNVRSMTYKTTTTKGEVNPSKPKRKNE